MAEECVQIPVRVIRMLFIEHYFAAFWAHVQAGSTHSEAWFKIEDELQKYELPTRFDNYESFKAAKSYYYKKRANPINFW